MEGIDLDEAHQKFLFEELLQKLSLTGKLRKKLTIVDALVINNPEKPCDIFHNFIKKLTAFDYRVQKISSQIKDNQPTETDTEGGADWISLVQQTDDYEVENDLVGARDILYAILTCSDPFLQQEMIIKLAACQLAVPIIMPSLSRISCKFLLWGLRKISKSWYDVHANAITTEDVVSHHFMAISAVRMGNVNISKSNVINKLIGPVQGNDDHAYFTTSEQDPYSAEWSKGTLECVWFLPNVDREKRKLETAFTFLNLRGDALKFHQQASFAVENSIITIVFIDINEVAKLQTDIENIKKKSYVILVLVPQTKGHGKVQRTTKAENLTIIKTDGLMDFQLSEIISNNIQYVLKHSNNGRTFCIEKQVELCRNLGIEIDEESDNCIKGKTAAQNVLASLEGHEDNPKTDILPLQPLWKKWANLDKDKAWQFKDQIGSSKLQKEKNTIRKEQSQTPPSKTISLFSESLLLRGDELHFFVGFVQLFLNELCNKTLKPLGKELTRLSNKKRVLNTELSKLTAKLGNPEFQQDKQEIEEEVKLKTKEEDEVTEKEKEIIGNFDEKSIGLEHFMREIGQIYESDPLARGNANEQIMDSHLLPKIAANLLLHGYPVEILDGDAGHVPLLWVKAVLEAVALKHKGAKVYVMSILGIQSSGKSTLLNSMFGVRFAVSAGRCTRGIFLQLLPVERSLKEEIGCDFIAIVDTEGLRAPEKSINSSPEQDNELATFALCISDLTLINIGGQTMGEDMTNVLQIAAHAFIRMKEVNLRTECRIVQQFVADVTAEDKNEAAMQSIMIKLDEAIKNAAKEEGKDQFRQFDDVFGVQNYNSDADNVQYIPSLWRGFMSAPDYQYSVKIQQLRGDLIQSMKSEQTYMTFKDFSQRIIDVWYAVKKENFVFSFQNTKEVTLYEEFMTQYRDWITQVQGKMIQKQLDAIQSIEAAKPDKVRSIQTAAIDGISTTLQEECGQIKDKITKALEEQKFLPIAKHSVSLHSDLENFKSQTKANITTGIASFVEIHNQSNNKSPEKEAFIEQLLERVPKLAENIKQQIADTMKESSSKEGVDEIIDAEFNTQWSEWMKETEEKYPIRKYDVIFAEIEQVIQTHMRTLVEKSAIAATVLDLLKEDIKNYSSNHFNETIDTLDQLAGVSHEMMEPLFHNFTETIAELALDRHNFIVNARVMLQTCLEFTQQHPGFIHKATLIAFASSLFVSLTQKHQVQEEGEMIYSNHTLIAKICEAEGLIGFEELEENILACFVTEIMEDKSMDEQVKRRALELLQDHDETNPEETGKQQNGGWFAPIVKGWKGFKDYFRSHESWKMAFQRQLGKINKKLRKEHKSRLAREEPIRQFCVQIVTFFHGKRVPEEHIPNSILVAFQWGLKRFKESLHEFLDAYISSAKHHIKYAEPVKFPTVESKIKEMLKQADKQINEVELNLLKKSFTTDTIRHYSSLRSSFISLQFLDPGLFELLDGENSRDISFAHEKICTVKVTFMKQKEYRAPFRPLVIGEHISNIVNDKELSNNLRSLILVHLVAWMLPICTEAQFAFEKSKNVATLLQEEKSIFETSFKSHCSDRQDQIIAKTFCDMLGKTAKDGLKYKVYPLLFKEMKNNHDPFTSKRAFIGSVLKEICKTDDFKSLVEFLRDFTSYGKRWILEYVSRVCNTQNTSLLRVIHETCIKKIEMDTLYAITMTEDMVKETSDVDFQFWLKTFRQHFEEKVGLKCKDSDIEKVGTLLNVINISLFTKECSKILQDTGTNLQQLLTLPTAGDAYQTQKWLIDNMPNAINLELFNSLPWCTKQCTFCGAICDKPLSNHVHQATLHLPQGIKGQTWYHTDKLVAEICTSLVESDFLYGCKDAPDGWRPYKEYKKDHPDWNIQGTRDDQPTDFWKYMFAKHNKDLAKHHNEEEGDLPEEWGKLTQDKAIYSLDEMFALTKDDQENDVSEERKQENSEGESGKENSATGDSLSENDADDSDSSSD